MLHTPDAMWDAVLRRDGRHDGCFVYAVRSTGVYCRPSCPARRPRRDRVVFYAGPREAEQAGYRACLRCRPGGPSADAAMAAQVCRLIDGAPEGRVTLAQLAEATGLSAHHLQRRFRGAVGLTPFQYAEARRMARAKEALRAGRSVADAVYAAGFGSGSRLYERAAAHLGMTPAAYRARGRGQRIRYALTDSAVGTVLVAATDRGVCMVSLGDDAAELESALAREYPAAERTPDPQALGAWVAAVLARIDVRDPVPDLPLDVRGTVFQRRVWEALQDIPAGETRTYREIAGAIGHPRAVRAVARACATNPAAVAIPCHRVLRADGDLAGYRWGLERKRLLLLRENPQWTR